MVRYLKQNNEKAAKLFKIGCDGGHSYSCSNLGLLYSKGSGVAQDYSMAARFSKKPAWVETLWGVIILVISIHMEKE